MSGYGSDFPDSVEEMKAKYAKEWYPHIVIFQLQKVPYDMAPVNCYYRMSRDLWEDMQRWLSEQDDAYKL